MKIILSIILFSIPMVGCRSEETITNAPASKSERIANITKTIQTNKPLPSKILDVEYFQLQFGDGRLGPSDYYFYARISVDPKDTSKWIKGLEPPFNNTTQYSKPKSDPSWWITEKEFADQKLYETKTLFNRFNGWICINTKKGYIYVYTFTM